MTGAGTGPPAPENPDRSPEPGSPWRLVLIMVVLAATIAILVLLSAAAPAAAQEPVADIDPDTTMEAAGAVLPDTVHAERITVTVAGDRAPAGGASALQVRIDSLPLSAAPVLSEALRETPLVEVRANSRGEAQLTLRGAESRQVAVLVDGVPLTLGWDDRADLSLIPVGAAEGIRVVRGLSSVLEGPNVLGGAVEVRLADGVEPAEGASPIELGTSIDHAGGRAASLGVDRAVDWNGARLRVRAGGAYRTTPGVPLPDGVRDLASRDGLRGNSDFEHASGYLSARLRGSGGAWGSLSTFGYRAEKGVPAELHVEEPRLWRIPAAGRWVTAVSGGTGWRATPWGAGDLEASLGVDLGRTEIETYESLEYRTVEGGETGRDRTVTVRLVGDHTLGRGSARGGLTLAETRHRETLVDGPGDPGETNRYRQRFWSGGVEVEHPVAEALGLSAGLSADGSDTPESGDKPPLDRLNDWGGRLGATLRLGDGIRLHGGASRRARFPSLRELYSGALGKFAPNPVLRPEILKVLEAGLTARAGDWTLQAVGFRQVLDDAIVRAPVGDGRLRRENRDEIESWGVELLADRGGRRLAFDAALTLQDVVVRDPTAPDAADRAEYQPAVAGSANLTAALPVGLRARGGVRVRSRQFCVHPDLERDVALDPDAAVDLSVSRDWRSGAIPGTRIVTILAVDNLGDQVVFDQCGLPGTGRTLRFEVRLR